MPDLPRWWSIPSHRGSARPVCSLSFLCMRFYLPVDCYCNELCSLFLDNSICCFSLQLEFSSGFILTLFSWILHFANRFWFLELYFFKITFHLEIQLDVSCTLAVIAPICCRIFISHLNLTEPLNWQDTLEWETGCSNWQVFSFSLSLSRSLYPLE